MKNIHLKLIFFTPIFILLAHYLAMLPHEYSHSITAWLLGYKSNPLALTYGGTSWLNLLLLTHMDENVDYHMIFSTGHGLHAAIIAFSGPGFANVPLFILSFLLLRIRYVKNNPLLWYFLFLFNLMNLGNFYDYIPIRTFSAHDDVDVANFVRGLNISPWWVYIFAGYIVAFLIWQFFTKTLVSAYINLRLTTTYSASLMIICVCILFGYFGGFPYIYIGRITNVDSVTYLLSATSFIAIPGLITVLWPTRSWVKYKLRENQDITRPFKTVSPSN